MRPLLIVGTGFAGITVAEALNRHGIMFDLLESSREIGGALRRAHNPLYGWDEGVSGPTLADRLASLPMPALGHFGLGQGVSEVEFCTGNGFSIRTTIHQQGDFGELAPWERVLLCTGTAPRHWEVPGSATRWGRGVELSTHARGAAYAGQSVAVIGGGDAAAEGALRLAAMGCRVWMVVRGEQLTAQPRFAYELIRHPDIMVCFGCVVTEVESAEEEHVLRSVQLSNGRRLSVAGLFVRVGVAPVLPRLVPAPQCDEGGYLRVDETGESSVPGLFAAGEVTGRATNQLADVHAQANRVATRLIALRR